QTIHLNAGPCFGGSALNFLSSDARVLSPESKPKSSPPNTITPPTRISSALQPTKGFSKCSGRPLSSPGHRIGHANSNEQTCPNPPTTKHIVHTILLPPLHANPLPTLSNTRRPLLHASRISLLAAVITSLPTGFPSAPQQTRSFSASASLGVRRVTFRPSRRVQKRRHGYLARKKDRNGRKTLIRRTMKGRRQLSW
ncbi:hypothetical protein N7461_008494, partial [Penicillium sp. DV-2018c]